ncbi:MAG: hypothetical protein II921_03645 [Treponema sp.]|nr:hypothetical protein [Treponema sp.]
MGRNVFLGFVLFLLCTSFFSCASPAKTTVSGSGNVAYLQLVAADFDKTSVDYGKYDDGVTVVIDGKHEFHANVNNAADRLSKNFYTYKIATGTHDIQVVFNGNVVVNRKIFCSDGEIKVVDLP